MPALVAPAPVASHPPAVDAGPALGDVVRRLVATLAVACGAPALILYVGLQALGVVPAVLGALAWTYGATAFRHLTGRPTSALLVLMTVVLTMRTAFTVSTGNTYVYFLEPIVTDGVIAMLFLGSLVSARPLVARVAADFYPVTPEQACSARVRRLFQRLTAFWGAVCLLKSGLGFWLLESLSTADFVLVKTVAVITLTVLAVAVTVRASVLVLRTETRVAAL